jgi:hypothetical protein
VVYLKRFAIAVFSAGWVLELAGSTTALVGYIASKPSVTSFPVVDFMRDGFTRSIIWLALVVAYWTWRYRRRLWWLVAAISVLGLAPTLYFGRAFFEQVKVVFGNGMRPFTPVPDGAMLVSLASSRALSAFAWWLAIMLAFWAWRLSSTGAPDGSA